MSEGNILELRHLQKAYGRHEVLKDISFSVRRGEILGLLGKNGSGKTTLMKSVLGLLAHSGEVIFDGKTLNPREARAMNRIGVLVDTAFFEDMTAYDNLKILMLSTPFRDNRRMGRDIMDLLTLVGLEENAKERVKGFSFGMKQRLALAQTLMNEPELLILDEPFVGLDPPGITLVKEKLAELCRRRTAIIFSSHQLAEVEELSEEIVAIEDGYVRFCGTYAELARRNREYRIIVDRPLTREIMERLTARSCEVMEDGDCELLLSHSEETLDPALRSLIDGGFAIREILREDRPLEALFS